MKLKYIIAEIEARAQSRLSVGTQVDVSNSHHDL